MPHDAERQPQDLGAANEANFGQFLALQEGLGGAEVLHDPTVTWAANEDPMFWFNMAIGLRLDDDGARSFLERLQASHRRLRTAVLLWLSPLATPAGLAGRLEAAGFADVDGAPAMAADLSRIVAPDVPEGVTVERVADSATLGTFVETLLGGNQVVGAEDIWNRFFTLAGLQPEGPVHNFLGRLDGRPVSCATIFLAAGVAGVYCVATVPAARRRGIAGAVTAAALAEARRRGYRYGILQASAMAANLYRDMGFEDIFSYRIFRWAPPE